MPASAARTSEGVHSLAKLNQRPRRICCVERGLRSRQDLSALAWEQPRLGRVLHSSQATQQQQHEACSCARLLAAEGLRLAAAAAAAARAARCGRLHLKGLDLHGGCPLVQVAQEEQAAYRVVWLHGRCSSGSAGAHGSEAARSSRDSHLKLVSGHAGDGRVEAHHTWHTEPLSAETATAQLRQSASCLTQEALGVVGVGVPAEDTIETGSRILAADSYEVSALTLG